MENKKYKFIEDDFRRLDNENRKAYRIVALKDFADVKKGDLGGYVEKEENLSHEGFAWVYDDGVVFDNARVKDDATVHDRAVVCGNALIKNSAKVMDAARISESAVLCDSACAMDWSTVCGLSVMTNNSVAAGFSTIGKAVVCTDTVRVYERATVWGDIKITGDSHIYGIYFNNFMSLPFMASGQDYHLPQFIIIGMADYMLHADALRELSGNLKEKCVKRMVLISMQRNTTHLSKWS